MKMAFQIGKALIFEPKMPKNVNECENGSFYNLHSQ